VLALLTVSTTVVRAQRIECAEHLLSSLWQSVVCWKLQLSDCMAKIGPVFSG